MSSRQTISPVHYPAPRADAGLVNLPNVNGLIDALDMREARAPRAQPNVIETARSYATLDLLKK